MLNGESVREFQGNLGLNFDLGRESMALVSGNTACFVSNNGALGHGLSVVFCQCFGVPIKSCQGWSCIF